MGFRIVPSPGGVFVTILGVWLCKVGQSRPDPQGTSHCGGSIATVYGQQDILQVYRDTRSKQGEVF